MKNTRTITTWWVTCDYCGRQKFQSAEDVMPAGWKTVVFKEHPRTPHDLCGDCLSKFMHHDPWYDKPMPEIGAYVNG